MMSAGALEGCRVLVVEDEYFLADDLDQGLRAAGAVVLGPVSAVISAFAVLERETIDVAVLDVNLAGERVYSFADALVSRGVPFLFTTGYDLAELPDRHIAVRRLEKPVEVRAILGAVQRLITPGRSGAGLPRPLQP